jgi:hypothetical protein
MLLKIGLDSILVYCRIQHDKVIISIYIVFYRAALKAPHSSADPPPPGRVVSNEEARLLSSSLINKVCRVSRELPKW